MPEGLAPLELEGHGGDGLPEPPDARLRENARTADPYWEASIAAALRRTGAHVVELPGADHALELREAASSARVLAGVLDGLRGFLVVSGQGAG